jgi:FAD/FMN-containing dehydrogenase/ferredoxin
LVEHENQNRRGVSSLVEQLRSSLSDEARVLEGSFERGLFGRDLARVPTSIASTLFDTKPTIVVQPRTEEDIEEVLDIAQREGLSVIPRGIASSAFGGALPTAGGIALDLSAMAKILAVDEKEGTVTVEPGVRWADLAGMLKKIGRLPMTTPTSRFSTVGGWASTGGIGVDSFRYGHFSEALLSARVVTPRRGVLDLVSNDPVLADCIGSEGQLGVFSQLTLRTRPIPEVGRSHLLYFDGVEAAFAAIEKLDAARFRPSHVVFMDEAHMEKERAVIVDRFGTERSTELVEHIRPRNALLLHCDSTEADASVREAFDAELSSSNKAHDVGASYLWSERFFPLKGQRLGPNLLATEVVLDPRRAPRFVSAGRRLGRRFGAHIGFDATVSRDRTGDLVCVVIASFACDTTRRLDYMLRLVLVQLLTHLAVRLGGRPYGVGVWNATFKRGERRRALRARKAEHDPESILNPRKFFGVQSKYWNLPALLFHPWVLATGLWLLLLASPLVGLLARILGGPTHESWDVPSLDEDEGGRLLDEAEQRCTLCGSCVSTCPAYLVTRDEQVSGRSKLHLARELSSRAESDVSADEAFSPFQCIRCGLCEEVCQTRLPLRECYTAMEERVVAHFGEPGGKVDDFIERLEADKEWIERTYGLDIAEWLPRPGESLSEGDDDLELSDGVES